ncbi:MAG: taurine dioxygenase [Nitrospirales bacterium]|nr:MAG: taurine dioxygenase [Nitrospirales bacterium]
MRVQEITPVIGSEITELDLSQPLSKEVAASLNALFVERLVLVFRDQRLSRDQHKAFARNFGDIHIHPSKRNGMNKDDPDVFIVDTKADAKFSNGEAWHSDVSCEEIPPAASLLYVSKIPDNGGGDTMFANMSCAFKELSDPMKQLLLDKDAYHDGEIDLLNYGIRLRGDQTYPKATHPVITKHPVSGEPILFVNGSFTSHIEGLARWESDLILNGLHQFVATNPRIQCRVRWTEGTLVMWDNRSAQHHAIRDYAGYARYGERVSTVDGVRPMPYQAR